MASPLANGGVPPTQHPLQFGSASTFVEIVDIPIIEGLSERFLRANN
jgi:hypothetical protein